MTNLATALILALQTMVPNISKERLKAVTEDMVSVVDEEFDGKDMKSTLTKHDALAMLAAVATHESGLRESVENCKFAGDAGKSVGLTQLMQGPNWEGRSRKDICGNRKIQFKLALHVLDRCWQSRPKEGAVFRCYASGDHRIDSWAARDEHAMYKKLRAAISAELAKSKFATTESDHM